MTTVNELIKSSLKDAGIVGVGQTPSATDSNDGFVTVNQMIMNWNVKRWLEYVMQVLTVTTTGATTYTIGPGGDIDTGTAQRPAKLGGVVWRQSPSATDPVDYPLTQILSREDYEREIPVKSIGNFPQCFFYETTYPLGALYAYPIPQASGQLRVSLRLPLTKFTSLQQTISIPEEYESAIRYNLAIRLAANYRLPITQELKVLAKDSLQTIRSSNSQISTMEMPVNLPGRRRGGYNIYSDQ